MPSSLSVTSTALLPTVPASAFAAAAISLPVSDRPPRRLGQFLAVRRDDGRAAIDREIAALRIDDHRLAELLRAARSRRGSASASARPWRNPTAPPRRRAACSSSACLISAASVLASTGFAPSPNRRAADASSDAPRRSAASASSAATVDHQMRLDRGCCACRAVAGSCRRIVADHADEKASSRRGCDVARDIAGAADHDILAVTAITGAGASGEMRDTSAIRCSVIVLAQSCSDMPSQPPSRPGSAR